MTSQAQLTDGFSAQFSAGTLRPPSGRAREMGGLSLADALLLCELLAKVDPARYERAALRWLQRFIDERLPPLTGDHARRISARGALAKATETPASKR